MRKISISHSWSESSQTPLFRFFNIIEMVELDQAESSFAAYIMMIISLRYCASRVILLWYLRASVHIHLASTPSPLSGRQVDTISMSDICFMAWIIDLTRLGSYHHIFDNVCSFPVVWSCSRSDSVCSFCWFCSLPVAILFFHILFDLLILGPGIISFGVWIVRACIRCLLFVAEELWLIFSA